MKIYPECDIHNNGDYTFCETCRRAWHYREDEFSCPLALEFEAQGDNPLAPARGVVIGVFLSILFWIAIAVIGYGGFAFVQWLNRDLSL